MKTAWYGSGAAMALARFPNTMDWFRELVRNGGVVEKRYSVTGNKIVSSGELAQVKAQLGRLGFEIDVRAI